MAKSDPNLLTQAEYARHRTQRKLPGGSREAVRKAVDDKSISTFGPDKLIDAELADAQWARNRRARVSPEAAAAADLLSPSATPETSPASSPAPTTPPATQPIAPASVSGYTEARARREIAEAEQSEIALKKLRRELVVAEDVDRAGFEIGRDMRDTMEAAVNGLAAEVAAVNSADACADILRRHHRAVCDALVRAWREKMGEPLRESAA
jgi:hypothetical protein